ncbi:MAG: NAD-dependent epimerase/dehydratase family protein [Candidatus Aminicenantes bacterium]|nr:NAD-dependent epimerase/dehydratase family protein [Candidatus Aminicenantes bacterium]
MSKKCLILGADGFLGSYFTEKLLAKGCKIRAFDIFRDGKSNNLEHLRGKIEFFAGDFLNQNDTFHAAKNINAVFHFISSTTPASSNRDPLIDIDVNLRATVHLLEKCVQHKVEQIVFPSSGGTIYGNIKKEKFSENDLTVPITPYGISKLAIERYLEYFNINFGLDYLIFRYSNPYGPRQNLVGSQGIIPIFLNKIRNNEAISIFGDGENVRDYIYIEDSINLSLEFFFKINRKFNVYNIGSGTGISINEIVRIIKKVTGKKFLIKYLPARSCDLRRVVLDNSRLLTEADNRNFVSLEEGIRLLWESI